MNYFDESVLVSTDWVAERIGDPNIRIIESNEDPLVYHAGHVPGAVEIDWTRDLNDPLKRDFIDAAAFSDLLQRNGISEDMSLVIYGDKNNWWACYAFYIFKMFGFKNIHIMKGGRLKWLLEERPMSREIPTYDKSDFSVSQRNDDERAFRSQVMKHLDRGGKFLDVRSPQEFTGEALHMPGYLSDGALRSGRMPGAIHLHWEELVEGPYAEFKSAEQMLEAYKSVGISPEDELIIYCRIGKRSSHNWFILKYLLGFNNVSNYDGGWLEWGNLMGSPIEK